MRNWLAPSRIVPPSRSEAEVGLFDIVGSDQRRERSRQERRLESCEKGCSAREADYATELHVCAYWR